MCYHIVLHLFPYGFRPSFASFSQQFRPSQVAGLRTSGHGGTGEEHEIDRLVAPAESMGKCG